MGVGQPSAGSQRRLIYDQHGKRLIAINQERYVAIPLQGLGLPDEPTLNLESMTFQVQVGREAEMKLSPSPPDADLELVNSKVPSGLRVRDRVVQWNPDAEQVGSHAIEVVLKSGQHRRKLAFEIAVTRPSIIAPHAISGLVVDPNQRFAVIW
ncbi:unnamed protein product, partial [Hapterophycus canaliculatus]